MLTSSNEGRARISGRTISSTLHQVLEHHCIFDKQGCWNSPSAKTCHQFPSHHQAVAACQSWHLSLPLPSPKPQQPLPTVIFHKNQDSLWLDQLLYINAIPNNTQEKHTSKYLEDASKLVNLLKFFFLGRENQGWVYKSTIEKYTTLVISKKIPLDWGLLLYLETHIGHLDLHSPNR